MSELRECKAEARLEAEGSEVREVDEGSWRIYLKGRGQDRGLYK